MLRLKKKTQPHLCAINKEIVQQLVTGTKGDTNEVRLDLEPWNAFGFCLRSPTSRSQLHLPRHLHARMWSQRQNLQQLLQGELRKN